MVIIKLQIYYRKKPPTNVLTYLVQIFSLWIGITCKSAISVQAPLYYNPNDYPGANIERKLIKLKKEFKKIVIIGQSTIKQEICAIQLLSH